MHDPEDLLRALAAAPRETIERLREASDGRGVLAALARATDAKQRALLCDVLGFRKEAAALAALCERLDDEHPRVRTAAADALAKLGDPRAGAALLARATLPEPDAGTRRMLAAALGAVGHTPAIPLLTELLTSDDPSLRGSAAWSLGALGARAAAPALRAALAVELAPYPAERMRAALLELGPAPGS